MAQRMSRLLRPLVTMKRLRRGRNQVIRMLSCEEVLVVPVESVENSVNFFSSNGDDEDIPERNHSKSF